MHAVLEHLDVLRAQAAHEAARLVVDDRGHRDDVDVHLEREGRRRWAAAERRGRLGERGRARRRRTSAGQSGVTERDRHAAGERRGERRRAGARPGRR